MNIYTYANEQLKNLNSLEAKVASALNVFYSKNKPTLLALPCSFIKDNNSFSAQSSGYEKQYNIHLYLFKVNQYGELHKVRGKASHAFSVTLLKEDYTEHLTRDGLSISLTYDDNACYPFSKPPIYFSDTEVGNPVWEEKPAPVEAPVSPESTPWPVSGNKHTLEVENAIKMVESYMREMPLDKKSKYSNGYGVKTENSYIPSVTECAVATTLMKITGSLYLPTCFRTTIPLPFGGVGTTPDGRGFSQEDKLNMDGCDIMKLDEVMSTRKSVKTDGRSIDVKHIPSVCNAQYNSDNAPAELLFEDAQTGKLYFRHSSLWTWGDNKTDEYVYVLRNTAYHISKTKLLEAMKAKEAQFKELFKPGNFRIKEMFIRNKKPSGKNGYKWNVYFSPEELADMAIRVFELDKIYAELLSEHGYELLDEIKGLFNDGDLRANLAYFASNLIINEKVRR